MDTQVYEDRAATPVRPTDRLARALRWGKWVMVAAWLVLVVAATPLADRLAGAQRDDAASQLPAGAQSTEVDRLVDRTHRPDTSVVVYHRSGGLTAADRRRVGADRTRLLAARLPGVGAVPAPRMTGDTAILVVPVATGQGTAGVHRLRALLDHGGSGLSIGVAGGQAVNADSDAALDGIDTTLLLAAGAVVIVLLLLTYRSPVLWLLPLVSVGLGLRVAQAGAYLFAQAGGTVSSMAAGILTVLAFGAGTDYALLLISRYREELHEHADRHEAMAVALRRSVGAIVASAGTVVAAMLCLLAASTGLTRGLGPVLAIGVVGALAAMVTLLPALLVVCGRWVFWPMVPRQGVARRTGGGWARIGAVVARRHRIAWVACALVLLALAGGLTRARFAVDPLTAFVSAPESVTAQHQLDRAFPTAGRQPAVVVVPPAEADAAVRAAKATPGVVDATVTGRLGADSEVDVALRADPYDRAAQDTVARLRDRLRGAAPGSLVGGTTAIQLDVRVAADHDDLVVVPLILLVVLLILMLLLRAVVSPLLLVGTVVLSFGAAYGVTSVLLRDVFGWAGVNPAIPLYAFLFLVALGVDYNIFLMHRARQESVAHGTRDGMRRALVATGGVITSAGLVLAGTFAVLTTLPLTQFVAVGVAVAFGVLLDTLLVRSVLVPALHIHLGDRAWWPARRH